ncbi:MAG: lipoprotein-releasing system permease protein [Vicingaceae bacterium]
MNLPFYIAKRYLVAKKSQNAINIISWISVFSVAVGTFALVVVLSAFNGLEKLVESLFESFDTDVRIELKKGKTFDANTVNYAVLTQIKGVKNYTKVLKEVCGVRYKGQQTIVQIKGVDESYLEMSNIGSNIVEGKKLLNKDNINYAIVGYGIGLQLGLTVDTGVENMTIYAPKRGKISTLNAMNSFYRKQISPAAIFYLSPEYDNKYIITPLSFAQDLLKYDNKISSIEITAEEEADLEELSQRLSTFFGNNFSIKSRLEFNQLLYKTNKTEKWVTFLILVFILMIAAFNILSSLSMLIIDKKKDITTLTHLGATKKLIRQIFFLEGILINLTGAISGMILGVIVCLLQEHVGLITLENGIVDYYPVSLNPVELIYILITVLVIGLLTSWYPVRNLTTA